MPEISLVRTRIISGTYEGVLTVGAGSYGSPAIAAHHLGQPLDDLSVTPIEGREGAWLLRVPIPPAILADGIQTILITDTRTGARLDSFTVVTGVPLDNDIRAEVDLLRAELDMLKRAFRRHCLESAG